MSERHPVYAQVYADKVQAVAAARGLFAEVYELLLARGVEVELRPFAFEKDEVPQIHRLDGFELHDGTFRPLIEFSVDSVQMAFSAKESHSVQVKYEPAWGVKKVPGFDQLVSVTRNHKRTPNAMDPKSICEFILKYAKATRAREAANLEKRAREVLKEGRYLSNDAVAKELRDRAPKGRAWVYASKEGHEDELYIQLRGTAAEIRQAVALLDAAFPLPQTITSRE